MVHVHPLLHNSHNSHKEIWSRHVPVNRQEAKFWGPVALVFLILASEGIGDGSLGGDTSKDQSVDK